MRCLLYASSDYSNLGCEAIVRGASEILNSVPEAQIGVATQLIQNDGKILSMMGVDIEKLSRNREGIDNIVAEILLRAKLSKASLSIPHFNAKKIAKKYQYSFSMGGDNYCYSGRERFYRINNGMRSHACRNIFWGCSIEPNDIDEQMIKDLHGYEWIFPRESLTFEALKQSGIKNVSLCSDPAFVMQPKKIKIPLSVEDGEKKYIGVNLSPLIFKYAENPEAVKSSVLFALKYILEQTSYDLCFIPHVYPGDININKMFAQLLGNTSRIVCFGDRVTAPEIKYLISRMSGMICARTHASIAAYSTAVPAFVLGYSVKSKGIAKDIYGTYKGHIMPVQEINDVEMLKKNISAFVNRIPDEKAFLTEFMPRYIKKAYLVADCLKHREAS